MRGLQPKEKRGLKYLLLAAKNGVSNPCVSCGCSDFGIVASYRWQISGLLEVGVTARTSLCCPKGQSGKLAHPGEEAGPGMHTLQNMSTENAVLGRSSSYRISAYAVSNKYSPCIILKFSCCGAFTPFQLKSFTTVSLGEFCVSILNLFFKISPLFLASYREDEETISIPLQGPFLYLNT